MSNFGDAVCHSVLRYLVPNFILPGIPGVALPNEEHQTTVLLLAFPLRQQKQETTLPNYWGSPFSDLLVLNIR